MEWRNRWAYVAVRRVPDSDQRRPIHVGAQLDKPPRDWRAEALRLAPLIANDNLLPVNDLGHYAVCPERVAELRDGVEREKRQLVERKAHGRHDVQAIETAVAVYRAVAFEALLLDTHIFRVDRRVNREPGQQAIWPGQVYARRGTAHRRRRILGEVFVAIVGASEAEPLGRAADRAAVVSRAPRGPRDVRVVEPVDRQVGGVVRAPLRVPRAAEALTEVAVHAKAAAPLLLDLFAVCPDERRRTLVQEIGSDVARSAERDVSILAGQRLSGLREPVMKNRGVLAAAEDQKEGVADRLSLVASSFRSSASGTRCSDCRCSAGNTCTAGTAPERL